MLTEELEMVDMSFGENLRRLRRDKGLTQAELGKLADMKITHMSKLENDTGDPKLSTLGEIFNSKGWTYRDGPTKPITEGLEAED